MIFEVRDGGFGYSSHECILKNVNFSLDEPQVLSVLGANGAGKTTLLKCMLGLLEWNTGGTFADGVNIKDIPYNQLWQKIGTYPGKGVGLCLQHAGDGDFRKKCPSGTFRQPKKRDWEIAEACMEEIGIGYLKGKLCSHISGGELQMVLIARALAANPSILVLDEPESNLDFRNQLIVLEAIERLCREKHISAVVNTHYPEHALSISQKALLLTAHGTTLFGPTDEILSEEHLNEAFGVEVRLYPLTLRNRTYTCVLPLGLKERMERGA